MRSNDFAKHDLSLMFDPRGRLWRFRPTCDAYRPGAHLPAHVELDANMTAAGLVVTLTAAGIEPGDVEVNLEGDVLRIDGKVAALRDLAATVGLPWRIAIANVQTAYADGVFEVRLPAEAAAGAAGSKTAGTAQAGETARSASTKKATAIR
jgi:HSP20 family molecular chaperone IbpA